MTAILELLSGVLRFFPSTMTVGLITTGIMLGKVSWVLVGIGAILLSVIGLSLQQVLGNFESFVPATERFILEACSLLPSAREGWTYSYAPSLWFAMTAFYLIYILRNAGHVYSTKPTKVSNDATATQQRKGIGLISMISVVILFMFLMVPRYISPCETRIGTVLGLLLGGLWGWAWWEILNAAGSDVYPDIHGVMSGLRPGSLRTNLNGTGAATGT